MTRTVSAIPRYPADTHYALIYHTAYHLLLRPLPTVLSQATIDTTRRSGRLKARAAPASDSDSELVLKRQVDEEPKSLPVKRTKALWKKKQQIRTNFTTPSLYVYIVKLYPNDYK